MGAEGPLAGRCILLTRPAGRAARLSAQLERWGAVVEVRPAIELRPPRDDRPVRDVVGRLDDFDWLVFTSANGIRFFEAALALAGERPDSQPRVAVVGPASAVAAEDAGLTPAVVARAGHAAGLAAELATEIGRRDRLLLVGPESPTPRLAERLRETGAAVEQVAFYRNAAAPGVGETVAAICSDRFDAVVLASPSALERLYEAAGLSAEALSAALARTRIVAIGPSTSEAVAARGLEVAAVARRPTDAALADALRRLFA